MTSDDVRETLLAELRAYQALDHHEEEQRLRVLELVESVPLAASREHFTPGHLTASAYIVDLAAQKILLHHHRRLDRWLQMGGHIEPGESPRIAAMREAEEESGLAHIQPLIDAIFDIDVHSIPAAKGEPAHLHHDIRYLFAASISDDFRIDPNESHDLRWFGLDEAELAMNAPEASRVLYKIRRLR